MFGLSKSLQRPVEVYGIARIWWTRSLHPISIGIRHHKYLLVNLLLRFDGEACLMHVVKTHKMVTYEASLKYSIWFVSMTKQWTEFTYNPSYYLPPEDYFGLSTKSGSRLKRDNAGVGDPGVLTSHEISPLKCTKSTKNDNKNSTASLSKCRSQDRIPQAFAGSTYSP